MFFSVYSNFFATFVRLARNGKDAQQQKRKRPRPNRWKLDNSPPFWTSFVNLLGNNYMTNVDNLRGNHNENDDDKVTLIVELYIDSNNNILCLFHMPSTTTITT